MSAASTNPRQPQPPALVLVVHRQLSDDALPIVCQFWTIRKERAAWKPSKLQFLLGRAELLDTRGCRLPADCAAPSSASALQFPASAAPASNRSGEASLLMVARSTPGASDLSLHLAARQPRQGLLTLKRVELRFAIELHAASLRTHPAGVCSILDEFALELRELPARDAD